MWHCSSHLPSLWISFCLIIPATQFISRLCTSEAMGKISSLPTQLFKCCFCDFSKVNISYSFKSLGNFILIVYCLLLPRSVTRFKCSLFKNWELFINCWICNSVGSEKNCSGRWMSLHRYLYEWKLLLGTSVGFRVIIDDSFKSYLWWRARRHREEILDFFFAGAMFYF